MKLTNGKLEWQKKDDNTIILVDVWNELSSNNVVVADVTIKQLESYNNKISPDWDIAGLEDAGLLRECHQIAKDQILYYFYGDEK